MKRFVGRENEKRRLRAFLDSPEAKAALVYGMRRIGKSTLIAEVAKTFEGTVISYFSINAPLEENERLFSTQLCETIGAGRISALSLEESFSFLSRQSGRYLVVIDEYQYMKDGSKRIGLDSLMQKIIDTVLGENTKLIITGSYVSTMKELMEEGNPLHGRFHTSVFLKEMSYLETGSFHPSLSARDKIAIRSIFGGSPYAASLVREDLSLKENIISLILEDGAPLRNHVENDTLKELGKAGELRNILRAVGNGRKKYQEICDRLSLRQTAALDRPLKMLLDAGIMKKMSPINRKDDRKKTFYAISDNLVRFYYTYMYGNNEGELAFMGAEAFYDRRIAPSLETFISLRFEDIVKEYFQEVSRRGRTGRIFVEAGTYWYDDPMARANGEFDVALRDSSGKYSIAEVKYLRDKMTEKEMDDEIRKIMAIRELDSPDIYIVSSSGFDAEREDAFLITGEELYSL